MYTHRIFPTALPPEQLDLILAHGWYRMGQSVFTCRFVIFGGSLYSAVWTRLSLDGYVFRRGLRQLMSRNHRRFKVSVGRAVLDGVKEELYTRYRAHFRGELAPSLVDAMHDEVAARTGRTNVFDTWAVEIFDDERLVAFSLFDRGHDSLASIIGVYDPDYSSHSLGFYTMLVEIEFGINAGFRYYYPGYIVPGYPALDYKLRIGPVDYFAPRERTWHPIDGLALNTLPAELLQRKLAELQSELTRRGAPSALFLYPPYELRAIGGEFDRCLPTPLFVICGTRQPNADFRALVYDIDRDHYLLLRCSPIGDVREHFPSFTQLDQLGTCCLDLIRIDDALISCSEAGQLATIVCSERASPA